ncbi:MAG: hypothetical protein IIZ73_03665 [Ruminococcus sp.]|nr:hypothetical protein [Ruminococcus sp.]
MTRGNGVMYYCPNGCHATPPPIAGSTKKVTCPKCGATIEVPEICLAGPVNCTACGEWFTA